MNMIEQLKDDFIAHKEEVKNFINTNLEFKREFATNPKNKPPKPKSKRILSDKGAKSQNSSLSFSDFDNIMEANNLIESKNTERKWSDSILFTKREEEKNLMQFIKESNNYIQDTPETRLNEIPKSELMIQEKSPKKVKNFKIGDSESIESAGSFHSALGY